MVKKLKKMIDDKNNGPQLASAIKDSAQQIWLAGLGAFSKAQQEGSKVFDALVKEGQSIQRKTHATAEEKITETASRMSDMASDWQSRAGNRWDKLENIFEERVAKALGTLGVPLAKDVQALAERVEQLSHRFEEMSKSGAHGSSQRGNGAASAPKARQARKTAARTTTPTTSRAAAKKASQPAASPASPLAAAKRPAARKTARSAAAKRAATQAASPEASKTAADNAV